MKLSKFAVPAILAATAFLPLVGAPTVAQGAAVTRTATKVAQPLLSQVKLNLGEVTVYDYGTLKLHAYKSNDVLSDECYVVEGKDGLVLLESSAFKDNVRELNQYIKSLKKPLEGMFLSYHPNGYTVYANAPIYATNEALASWNDNGGVAALTTNFVKAFGDAVDTNLPAKATPVKVGETVTVAGVDFKILATPDEDYSVEIPAIHAIYRHMLGSKVHSILPNLDYMDAEIADMERYQAAGYDMILTSHYVPEGQEAVTAKLNYLRTVKKMAASSKDKGDFMQKVKQAFPDYEGDNYLEMSAAALFPA